MSVLFVRTCKGKCKIARCKWLIQRRQTFLLLLPGHQQADSIFLYLIEILSHFYTIAQLIHSPCHGTSRDPLLITWPRPEGSLVQSWLTAPSCCGQLHNNRSSAAGLFSQRLAPQAGKTGTCKFWIFQLISEKKMTFVENREQKKKKDVSKCTEGQHRVAKLCRDGTTCSRVWSIRTFSTFKFV